MTDATADATTGATTDVTTDATTDTTASRSFGEGEQPEMHAARLRDGPATDAAKRRLVTSLFWALPPEAHRDGSFIHSTDDAIAAALLHADHESEPSDAEAREGAEEKPLVVSWLFFGMLVTIVTSSLADQLSGDA